jgi:hypothetical protein
MHRHSLVRRLMKKGKINGEKKVEENRTSLTKLKTSKTRVWKRTFPLFPSPGKTNRFPWFLSRGNVQFNDFGIGKH